MWINSIGDAYQNGLSGRLVSCREFDEFKADSPALLFGSLQLYFPENHLLADAEEVELHQFEQGEESHDHFVFAGRVLEERREGHGLTGFDRFEQVVDLVADGVGIVDNFTEALVILKAVDDVLKGANEIKDADVFRERTCFVLIGLNLVRLALEAVLLLGLAVAEKVGGFFELLVFDQLADQVPTWIFLIGILLGWLHVLGQHHAALDVAKVGRHDEELAGETNVEHLEGFKVGHVLLGDALDRDVVDVDFVPLDQVEQQVHGTFENVEFDLVEKVGHFGTRHRLVIVTLPRGRVPGKSFSFHRLKGFLRRFFGGRRGLFRSGFDFGF